MRAEAKLAEMDNRDVVRAYRRWAPVYDLTFGKLVEVGIKHATACVNRYEGRVLEVGVGTGLSLPCYKKMLKVTGIDLSAAMLARARERVQRESLSNIEQLREMDATKLGFANQSFDIATAMYVMTVVPEPAAVMHELARVTKIGGQIFDPTELPRGTGFLAHAGNAAEFAARLCHSVRSGKAGVLEFRGAVVIRLPTGPTIALPACLSEQRLFKRSYPFFESRQAHDRLQPKSDLSMPTGQLDLKAQTLQIV